MTSKRTIIRMIHLKQSTMKQPPARLSVYAVAMIVVTMLLVPNGCSADNLRAKRRAGGIISGLPITNLDNEGEEDQKAILIDQADKEFFLDFVQNLASFDTLAPTTSITKSPVVIPTPDPTAKATPIPSKSPTGEPTGEPSGEPSGYPTPSPTEVPTAKPTETPTKAPTVSPTVTASQAPSDLPSEKEATPSPTESPSKKPTEVPSGEPSEVPTEGPSETPTVAPTTKEPSGAPSGSPSVETASPFVPPTSSPVPPPTPSPVPPPTPSPVLLPTPSPVAFSKCNISEAARSALINIFLRVVSNPADVDTPGSPQMLALNWMIDEDPMQVCPQDKFLIQRYVMSVFYFSTRGDRWTECSAPLPLNEVEDPEQAQADANAQCSLKVAGFESSSNAWLTGGSECGWGGLGCNEDNFITRIEMEQNGVAGTLPFELNRLQTLKNLILEEGILTGTIPSQLSEIRSLEQIDLNFNLLQGLIPEELYALSNLRQMDLNDNELTGTISSSISSLSKLSFFQIENNLFTGTVPDSIGALKALEVATMDNNQLSGTMPCNFTNIKVLTADCLGAPNRPSPPLVICECCTQCF